MWRCHVKVVRFDCKVFFCRAIRKRRLINASAFVFLFAVFLEFLVCSLPTDNQAGNVVSGSQLAQLTIDKRYRWTVIIQHNKDVREDGWRERMDEGAMRRKKRYAS